jgi:hypothetical protein
VPGRRDKSVASLPPEFGVAEPARPAPLDHVVHSARRAPRAAPVLGGPEPLALGAWADGPRYLMLALKCLPDTVDPRGPKAK